MTSPSGLPFGRLTRFARLSHISSNSPRIPLCALSGRWGNNRPKGVSCATTICKMADNYTARRPSSPNTKGVMSFSPRLAKQRGASLGFRTTDPPRPTGVASTVTTEKSTLQKHATYSQSQNQVAWGASPLRDSTNRIQRTHHPQTMRPHRDMQINFRRRNIFMPQKLLDCSQIRPRLE